MEEVFLITLTLFLSALHTATQEFELPKSIPNT